MTYRNHSCAESTLKMDASEDQVTRAAHRAFDQILEDRDNLATENYHLKSCLAAQQLQLQRYEELLRVARGEQPETPAPVRGDVGVWAAGTFLYLPSEDGHLASVVTVLQQTNGKQRALALLTILLGRELTDARRISGLLLLSTVLRGSSQDVKEELLQKALASADQALELAFQLQNPKLVDARWSLALASNTDPAYAEAVSATWSVLE
ncbi:MAG: hypothetical protein Q9191_005001 [Dirinaria sp. TL-2023a]